MRPKTLLPEQIARIVALRRLEDPPKITDIARRFGVCERTIYYILAAARKEQQNMVHSSV